MASAHFDFNSKVGNSAEALNFYQLLGVGQSASQAEINKRYKEMAIHIHPDKNFGIRESEELMKRLNQAREVLCDSEKRIEYDEHLSNDDSNTPIATDLM